MPDITLCQNDKCPIKINCKRAANDLVSHIQSFTTFEPQTDRRGNTYCAGYWPIKSITPDN